MRSIGHSSDHQHDKSSRQQQAQRPVPISIHRRERLLGKAAAPHLKIGSHAADYEHQGRRRAGPRQHRCAGERDWVGERQSNQAGAEDRSRSGDAFDWPRHSGAAGGANYQRDQTALAFHRPPQPECPKYVDHGDRRENQKHQGRQESHDRTGRSPLLVVMMHRVNGVVAISAQLGIPLPLACGQKCHGREVILEVGFA